MQNRFHKGYAQATFPMQYTSEINSSWEVVTQLLFTPTLEYSYQQKFLVAAIIAQVTVIKACAPNACLAYHAECLISPFQNPEVF